MEKLKKIPSLRFSEFKGNWNNRKIKEILSIGSGRDYKNLGVGEVPVFGTGGLMTKVDSYLNDGETVCIGRKGTIDKPMYFKGKIWTVDTLFFTHSFKESDPKFVYYLFQRVNWKQHNEAGGVPSLSKSTIEQISLSLPPLPEQQKIASFLSAVDEKIQQLTRKASLLEQYKKGVMQQLFSGKLRFKDENGKDYTDWEEKRLGDFCTFFSGGTPTSTNQKLYSGTIPFIGSGNIYDSEVFSFISEEALKSSSAKIVEKGDLLYALYGANSGELAISKMYGAINQAILCIRNSESIEYLYYVLLFNKDNIVAKFLQGGQGNLSAQIIKRLKYKFPSIKEQQKIANFLSSVDAKIESTDQQINQTQSFKKGLLQKLFV
jgi:type I restriction enzyme S subunit